MQLSIYYRESEKELVAKIEQKAKEERKSKSAVILSIIDDYFKNEESQVAKYYEKEIAEFRGGL